MISQYLKPSDSLTVDLDPASNRLLGLGVISYLDTKDDVVTLVVQMNTLPDGDIDVSRTGAAAVGGFIYRPKLGDRLALLTQADVGGGAAFTVSATGAIEFPIKPWVGLAAGYNVLRIDTGNVPTNGTSPIGTVEGTVTQYGPVFTMVFHWAEK